MVALLESTGFCKSGVALPNGEDAGGRQHRRALLLWETDGAHHAPPLLGRLRAMVGSRGKAAIRPFRSPCRGPQRPQAPLIFSTAKFAQMPNSTVSCYPEHFLQVNVP